MDDPSDLSARRTPDGWSDGDDDVARSMRAALGEPAPVRPGERPSREVLAGLERRAVRHHRRRQAMALAGAAAAAAVVVVLGGLVLPLPGLVSTTSGSSADSAGSAPAGGAGGETDTSDSRNQEMPSTASRGDALTGGVYDAPAAVVPLTAASMLRAEDVTAFDVAVRDEQPVDDTGSGLSLFACAAGHAALVEPPALWRVDLTADPTTATSAEPPGLVERVAEFAAPDEATSALTTVDSRLPLCSGPGPEGTGPTTALDAASVTPVGGQALVLASMSGQGSPTLRILLVSGTTLVQLEITSDAASADEALANAVDTARTALELATGGQATFPAGAP